MVLSQICTYSNDKISIIDVNENTYISTENMLPNKAGIMQATSLPSTMQVKYYKKSDVLVSNIRPYFKKIWIAEHDGGCSNDVLVFRAKETVNPYYLFYVLSCDDFFEYAMATSKGTKMPRGDKNALLEYEIPEHSYVEQVKIENVLRSIDDKIDINNKINNNLEQQAQILYKAWFLDFEPFGGVMPKNWTLSTLGNVATIKTRSFSPTKNPSVILEHYSIPAYDEKHYPVFETAEGVKSNKYILTSASVMISKLNPNTKRIWRPLCLSENPVCSTEFIIYEAKNPDYKDFVYSIIDSTPFSDYLCAYTTGSTNSRQRATPSVTLDFPIVVADDAIIKNFCGLVTPMYDHIATNICENQQLAALRDSLLPRLMSGEIDVSDIQI